MRGASREMHTLSHALCENLFDRTDGRYVSIELLVLETFHGPVDAPARLLEAARAHHLVLPCGAVDILARPLHRPLVARGRAHRQEEVKPRPR